MDKKSISNILADAGLNLSQPDFEPGLNPTNKKSQIQFFFNKSENFGTLKFFFFLIGSNFLVQLAGQISENNIQIFLKGSQFEKLGKIFQKSKMDPNSGNFSGLFCL